MANMLVVQILLLLFGGALADCPAGYESHGDFCYTLLRVKATWAESQDYCKALGGGLAVISDQAESDFVTAMLNKQHASIQTAQIWLGGTDLLQEGTWLAPGTLETLSFFNWAPGEPDNNDMASIQTTQIWLGGTDLLQEGTWLAPGTLETLSFFNWAPGEPDNNDVGQHCLAIFNAPPKFKWDDSWCDHAMQPLCQMMSSGMTEVIG